MGDHELEVGAKFGVPEFHGFAASIEARYKARWGKRTNDVLTAAAETADLEPAQLGAALEANDDVSDLMYTAMNRAVEVSDPDYISALGRLVGQALDPALIDEVAYLTTELTRLEPLHLRALLCAFVFLAEGQYVDDPTRATIAAAAAEQDIALAHNLPAIAERLRISSATAQRIVDRLDAEGLASTKNMPGALRPTDWGGRALLLIFPNLAEVWLGSDNYARRTDL